MTPSHLMADLLADLQVDLARPGPSAPPAPAPALPARSVPALELRVTPLHWAAPRLRRSRARWAATAGPVQAVLLLG